MQFKKKKKKYFLDNRSAPKNDFDSAHVSYFESPIKSRKFSVFHSLLIIMSDQTDSWEQAT